MKKFDIEIEAREILDRLEDAEKKIKTLEKLNYVQLVVLIAILTKVLLIR